MQSENRFFDDFAKMVNGIAGTVAGAGREAEAAMRDRAKEFVGRMDFVSREEFEAVKQMAATARAEAEALKARLDKIEGVAKTAAAPKAAAKPAAAPAAALISAIVQGMQELNVAIGDDRVNLGPGFQIGHSFFTPAAGQAVGRAWFERVVETEIRPLLEEYWFDAPDRADEWRVRLLSHL